MAILSRPPALIRLLPIGGGVAAGLAVVVSAVQPLGATGRWLVAIGGGVAAAVCWAVQVLIAGPGHLVSGRPDRLGDVTFRRADRHPDAPPRRPMTAADLGTPLMDIVIPPVDRAPPRDVETPALRVPRPSVSKSLAAATPLAPGERLDTFTLPPPPTRAPAPGSAPSADALLRRLEGAPRRPARF